MSQQCFSVAVDSDSQVRAEIAAREEGLEDERPLQTAYCPDVMLGCDIDETRQPLRFPSGWEWSRRRADPPEQILNTQQRKKSNRGAGDQEEKPGFLEETALLSGAGAPLGELLEEAGAGHVHVQTSVQALQERLRKAGSKAPSPPWSTCSLLVAP
jgi:hypothetical protein